MVQSQVKITLIKIYWLFLLINITSIIEHKLLYWIETITFLLLVKIKGSSMLSNKI